LPKFHVLKNFYFWVVVGVALLYQLVALIIYLYFPEYARNLRSEGELGENIAAVCWGLTAIFSFIKIKFYLHPKDNRWQWLWIMFAGILACARELDIGNRVEGYQGFSSLSERIGWAAIDVNPKFALYFVMFAMGTVMFVVIAVNFKKIIAELKQGNEMIALICLGFGVMGLGFLFDGSSLGNSTIYPIITRDVGKYIEEVFETSGAIMFFMAILPYFYTQKINLRAVE